MRRRLVGCALALVCGAAVAHGQAIAPAHSLVVAGDSSRAKSSSVSAQIRSLLDTTTITLDRLEVHKTSLAPGGSPHPPHRHAHEELMLVERGTIEVTQEGVVRRATTGALIFEASNELHGLKNIGADTATYWVIAIYPRSLAESSGRLAPQPATDSIPQHDTLSLNSVALGEVRRINVHVPKSYSLSKSTRFPVLYMPDGGIDEDFPHIVNTVDSLIALGEIRPVIVVGVPNTERRRDLTGPTRVHSDSAIAAHVGGSAAFRKFFRDELIPQIDKRYRTTSEQSIIGESLAGLFIVETFLRDPTLFDHYIAFDPSLWWNHGALVDSTPVLLRAAWNVNVTHRTARRMPRRTIYVAASRDDADDTQRFAAALRSRGGFAWTHVTRPDLTHGTIFRALAPAALATALQ